jgi:betaine lipid synthase
MNMYLTECTTVEYVAATFDPVIRRSLLKSDNYFYLLCLMGRYTPECSPDYLKPSVINSLKASGALESFRLHTDTVEQVLGRLTPSTLTKAVLMDHMDWMDWDGIEVRKEVIALRNSCSVPQQRTLGTSKSTKKRALNVIQFPCVTKDVQLIGLTCMQVLG